MESFSGSKEEWVDLVKSIYPDVVLDNTGTRTFAMVGEEDVGMYSVIQGGGWIKKP